MKTSEIKNIIDETLLETAKEVILTEQSNPIEQGNPLDRFPTLSCFKEYITNVENIGRNSKPGLVIDITNIDSDEFVNCCHVVTSTEAQSYLIKSLHNDLDNSELSGDYDIDVNMEGVGNNLNVQIKIISGEKLGGEMKENIEIDKNGELEETKTTPCECDKLEENDPCECDKTSKKIVSLSEVELLNLIKKIVVESDLVPGVSVTKDVTRTAGNQNQEYVSAVDKKMKDYLKFKGNSNPEFPKQNTGEKQVGHENTSEDEEYVDNNRGGGMQDYDYDTEPSDSFVDRVKKALTGDSTMGNSSEVKETANTIKTDTGEEILKKVPKKKKAKKEQPMYVKDKQPITAKEVALSEEEIEKKKIVQEDIQRIKEMYDYGEKTQ